MCLHLNAVSAGNWLAFFAGTTGFTLNLGGTTAPTTTASTGLSLGGALAGLGGSLFQNTSTAATGESCFNFFSSFYLKTLIFNV